MHRREPESACTQRTIVIYVLPALFAVIISINSNPSWQCNVALTWSRLSSGHLFLKWYMKRFGGANRNKATLNSCTYKRIPVYKFLGTMSIVVSMNALAFLQFSPNRFSREYMLQSLTRGTQIYTLI